MKHFLILASACVLLAAGCAQTPAVNPPQVKTPTTAPTPTPTPTTTPSTGLANPASVNCKDKGGTLAIQTDPNGGQYGLCYFEDNRACEEWALFRGECPLGGVKTTGFDTDAQRFCAWIGGKTLAVKDAICTFPDGSTCPDDALYGGTCHRGQNATSTE